MNKLKLIHNKDKFLLEINDTPLSFIQGYKIEANAGEVTQLTIKMSIDMDISSIDIEDWKVNLK